MTPPADNPRLIARPRAKLMVAAASALVLLVGVAARPRSPRPETPAEQVAPILAQEVQRREPTRLFRGLRETGRRVVPFTVAFREAAAPLERRRTSVDFARSARPVLAPSGFGLLVSAQGDVLTHRRALGPDGLATVVTADGAGAVPTVTAYDPETGLTLVNLAGWRQGPPDFATRVPEPGEIVLGAANAVGRPLAAPRFVASVDGERYLLEPAGLPPGTPVFNTDGEAVAVAGAPPVAFAVVSTLEKLQRLRERGRGIPATLGLILQAPDEGLLARLGPGLVVAGLLPGGPAENGGIRPGDVLLSLDGRALRTLDEAVGQIARLPLGRRSGIVVRRGGSDLALELEAVATMADAEAADPPPPPDAPPAVAVFASADLERAAVPPDARVLSVEGRPVAGSGLPRGPRRRGPPWLARFHDGTRPFFAVVGQPPAR